jgi:hypothetical protein
MAEYAPVYPESRVWTDTADYLLASDGEIIAELQKQYLKFGQFREPVVLKLNDPDEDAEDLIPGKIGYVADGTHRLVSAYLLGVESILVSDSFEESEELGYSIVTWISNVSQKSFSSDELEIFFDKFRSICISDSLWITSSTASGEPNGVSIYWDEYDSSLLPIVNRAVIEKLSELFPEDSFTVETFCEDWDS